MAFFRKKGLEVQPFKVGPDYIDPGFHHLVCSPRKSRNLDRFFLSEAYLKKCFEKNSSGADLALVEGVMGLFDGRGPFSEEGSTAEMAKLLGLPIFLVIDGSGLARSAAALVKGYQTFDPALTLAGILVNGAGSGGHFQWLKESIEKETGVPVLGWLPKDAAISIPERPLGLRTAVEEELIETKTKRLIELLENRFDAPRFLELSKQSRYPEVALPAGRRASPASGACPPSGRRGLAMKGRERKCRIGVAYDRAFSFYYEDNFDLLREAGAELVFFSPLEDPKLPQELDALYLGGGFPELYAEELSANQSMKASIREFYEEGGILYGECGGLIYLAESFLDSAGKEFPFVGLVPGKIRMTGRLQHFGYHEIETLRNTFFFPAARRLRSHEFHYSLWEVPSKDFSEAYQISDRRDGFYDGRLLASYQHLHFGQDVELARRFVKAVFSSSLRARRRRGKPACRQAGQPQGSGIASSPAAESMAGSSQ